jgi:hypothetical protein
VLCRVEQLGARQLLELVTPLLAPAPRRLVPRGGAAT